jgi:hypothetical protein
MAVHTGEVSECCELCFKYELTILMYFSILFQRPFKCQLCNDGFVKRYSLKLHMKKVHSVMDTNMVDYVIVEEDGGIKVD